MNTPKPNEIYRHFKGNLYRIITLAQDAETGERVVVYQALYGNNGIFTRTITNFLERLDKNKYPYANQIYRFEPLDNPMGSTVAGDFAEPAYRESERMKEPVYREPERLKEPPYREPERLKEPVYREPEIVKEPIYREPKNPPERENLKVPEPLKKTEGPQGPEPSTPDLDPLLLEFLDNSGHQERLDILERLRPRLTENMVNIMAVALETELLTPADNLDGAYAELRSYLLTMEKYERKHR